MTIKKLINVELSLLKMDFDNSELELRGKNYIMKNSINKRKKKERERTDEVLCVLPPCRTLFFKYRIILYISGSLIHDDML